MFCNLRPTLLSCRRVLPIGVSVPVRPHTEVIPRRHVAVCHRQQVVKWLFENRQEGCTPAAAEGAARQGHDEIVKYLKGHKRGRSVDYKDLGGVLGQPENP